MQNPWSDADVLTQLGWDFAPLIGEGGEARVFDIGAGRVLRLVRPGGQVDAQQKRAALLEQIFAGHTNAQFRTPRVIDIRQLGGRVAVIEERLPGITLAEALKTAAGRSRQRLIVSYLEAAASIGDIDVGLRFWGDILAPGIRAPAYRTYLVEKLRSVRPFSGPLAELLMTEPEALPDCATPSLVHFDIFPQNVLTEGDRVSAVIDFGAASKMADRRLDVWSAVAYLDEALSPSATERDRRLARDWLKAEGLDRDYPNAKRWIASCWGFAHEDRAVRAWCQRVLSALAV